MPRQEHSITNRYDHKLFTNRHRLPASRYTSKMVVKFTGFILRRVTDKQVVYTTALTFALKSLFSETPTNTQNFMHYNKHHQMNTQEQKLAYDNTKWNGRWYRDQDMTAENDNVTYPLSTCISCRIHIHYIYSWRGYMTAATPQPEWIWSNTVVCKLPYTNWCVTLLTGAELDSSWSSYHANRLLSQYRSPRVTWRMCSIAKQWWTCARACNWFRRYYFS